MASKTSARHFQDIIEVEVQVDRPTQTIIQVMTWNLFIYNIFFYRSEYLVSSLHCFSCHHFFSSLYFLLSPLCVTKTRTLCRVGTRYQSLDRGGLVDPHDREFIPIREPRDRSRDRSLERGFLLEEELYGRAARQSPSAMSN